MRFIYTKVFGVFFGILVLATLLVYFHYNCWLGVFQRFALQAPRPVSFLVRKTTSPIKSFFSNAYNLREIVRQNTKLSDQVRALQAKQVLFDQYEQENQSLRQELQFAKTSKLSLQLCGVMGRNPTGIIDTITINCGAKQGAEPGRAVISKGFLVGKITYAAEDLSTVQLITNASFSVDAKISQSGRLAIGRGSYDSGLVLDQISQDEPLERGMLVVTAGVNDKVVKNLLIGEVGKVISGPNDVFKKTTLISPVDFGDLEFVFLVK